MSRHYTKEQQNIDATANVFIALMTIFAGGAAAIGFLMFALENQPLLLLIPLIWGMIIMCSMKSK